MIACERTMRRIAAAGHLRILVGCRAAGTTEEEGVIS